MSQQSVIRVLDAETGQGIPFAHVCFESLSDGNQVYRVTDADGNVANICQLEAVVAVSYVGFETLYDTVRPGGSYEFKLKPRIDALEEIVVTAQYSPERADKSIYKVNVINRFYIEKKAAANLTDLLDNELSIRVSQDGALGSSMSLQGLSGEHVKILVDGVPVIGRMDGNIDLSQINLHNIEHLEIIEGPMSVIYGSNASAGVVNLISKKQGVASTTAGANAYVESVGVYNFDGFVSENRGRNGFNLSGGRNFFGGYDPVDTTRSKRWKPKRQYFMDGSYTFNENDLMVRVSGNFFNEKLQSKGNPQPPYHTWAFDNYFMTNRVNLRTELTKSWKTQRYLNAVVAWSYYDRRKDTYVKDLTTLEQTRTDNPGDHDTTRVYDYMARATYSRNRESINLNYQVGVDANYELGEGKRITGQEQSIADVAGFLSITWEPIGGLKIQPGVRAIYNSRYKAPLVYAFSVKYDPIESLTVRASMARGFRAPSIKELYLYFVDVNHNIQGNEDLQAENSYHINGSLLWHTQKPKHYYSAEIKVFYNDIRNVIKLVELDPNNLLWTYVNIDQYITKGIQFLANIRLYPRLNVQVGAGTTGQFNDLIYGIESDKKTFNWSPDVSSNIEYKIPGAEIDLSLFYRYTGRVEFFRLNSEYKVIEGFVEDYHNMDVTLGKRFIRDRLHLSLGVKNLFDNDEITAFGGSSSGAHTGGGAGSVPVAWGRTFFVKASFTFKKFGNNK